MLPGSVTQERTTKDQRGDRPPSIRRVRPHMPYRWCVLLLLAVCGFTLLAQSTSKGSTGTMPSSVPSLSPIQRQPSAVPIHGADGPANGGAGMGAGNATGARTRATVAADTCWNPLDASCWLRTAAGWIAQQIMDAVQPAVTTLMQRPLSLLTQTPPADTYSNPTVIAWWTSFLSVADLALACLIVIGGYNVVVGRHLGLRHAELTEFLPRLLLSVGAAHFSLYFLSLFIDLENALCAVAINLAGTSILTNIIEALFQGNLVGEGFLVWLLAVMLAGMTILLGIQMMVRLAMIWVLIVLAGPGLACLALSQTVGYGRLWLSLTANTIMVQFFQVVTLALGGTLITAIGVTNVLGLDSTLATLLVCIALLYLVLRLPGIVSRSTLRPMTDASSAAIGGAQRAGTYIANVAPRLLALV